MSTRPEQDGEVFFLSIPFHPLCYSNVTPSQLAREAKDGAQPEELTSTLVRLGARKLIEELLEAETADILGGRGRYARREAGQQGSRNGYKTRRLDCAEGRLQVDVPQVRGLEGVCQPSLW